MITIRHIRPEDSGAFLNLCRQLDLETHFMLLEPGERTTTLAEQRQRIESLLARDNQTILVAETEGQLAGYLAALGGSYGRNRHSAHIVIGILQAFTGQGLGARLFARLEEWARQKQIHRLELTVMTHNLRAIRLYQKMGFQVEGLRKDSLYVDGAYVDEYQMARLLE